MAFSLTRRGLTPFPLLYGMVLFSRMLGPGAELVPLDLAAPSSLHLKAWAVRLRGGVVHVLLIDKGSRSVRVQLKLRARGPAQIQRLLAPKLAASGSVTLDNQHLTSAATWAGTPRYERIVRSGNGYDVGMPHGSAALITMQLR